MNNIAVCLSSDNNYVQHLGAAISSVLKNKNKDEFINVYIIDGGIEAENIEKLKNEKVQAQYDELEVSYTNLKTATAISLNGSDVKETKLRLSKLVREVDKCIAWLNE